MGVGLLIFYVANVIIVTCYNEKSPFSGPPKISDFGVSFGRFRGSFILPLKGGGDREGLGDRGGLTIWLAWEKARSKARKICRGHKCHICISIWSQLHYGKKTVKRRKKNGTVKRQSRGNIGEEVIGNMDNFV